LELGRRGVPKGLIVGALVAAAAVARLYQVAAPSLWFDEGGSLRATNQAGFAAMFSDLVNTAHGDRFQPLYFMFLWVWRQAFGESAFSLRLPSVLFGTAAVLVLVLAARRLYGWEGAGWCAAFAGSSAFLVLHSQEARPYALLSLLVASQVSCLLRLRSRSSTRRDVWTWCFWLVTGVGSFASILCCLFTVGLAGGEAVVDRRLRPWLARWIPAAVASLPALIFFLASNVIGAPDEAQVTRLAGSMLRNAVFALYGVLVGTTYGPSLQQLQNSSAARALLDHWTAIGLLVALAGALLLVAAVAVRTKGLADSRRRDLRVLAVSFALSYVLMIAFTSVTKLNWQPRHSFFLAVPLSLLLPAIPMSFRGADRRRGWLWGARFLLVLLVALNGYSLMHYYFDRDYARDDYRAAAAYIRSHDGPGRPAVLLNGVLELLDYYGSGPVIDGRGSDQSRLASEVERLTDGAPEVLVVVNRQSAFWKHRRSLEAAMAPTYRLQSSASLPYFTMYGFARNSLTMRPEPLDPERAAALLAGMGKARAPFWWRVNPFDPSAATMAVEASPEDVTHVLQLQRGPESARERASHGHSYAVRKAQRNGLSVIVYGETRAALVDRALRLTRGRADGRA